MTKIIANAVAVQYSKLEVELKTFDNDPAGTRIFYLEIIEFPYEIEGENNVRYILRDYYGWPVTDYRLIEQAVKVAMEKIETENTRERVEFLNT